MLGSDRNIDISELLREVNATLNYLEMPSVLHFLAKNAIKRPKKLKWSSYLFK